MTKVFTPKETEEEKAERLRRIVIQGQTVLQLDDKVNASEVTPEEEAIIKALLTKVEASESGDEQFDNRVQD